MKTIAATDAKNRFGELIDMAQSGPVRVQRQGRDVAVVLSPEEFRRLSEAASGKVSPAVERLHATSAKRWSKVYEALAK
jgi:antitoxin Phd